MTAPNPDTLGHCPHCDVDLVAVSATDVRARREHVLACALIAAGLGPEMSA